MSAILLSVALIALAIWLVMLFGRGFFWWPRLPKAAPDPARWPDIVAVVPARDEAEVIEKSIGSLVNQNYPGKFSIVLVDDHSSDGTAGIARRAAAQAGRPDRLKIVSAGPLPAGWTGKLWALSEGVRAVGPAELLLFTDADIEHHPTNLRELAARLTHEKRDLVSLMVLLRCQSLAERFLIPAFVFFFAMLYPFSWSNDPRRRIAGAAGGCILVRREAYERIGGFAAIKGEMIDDCAFARAVKGSGGSIWLGLTQDTKSIRRYPHLADIWNMAARTAYTQLRYSPWLLAGTVLSMLVTYLAPPLLILAGGWTGWIAAAACVVMIGVYAPMVRFYNLPLAWAPTLPAIALVYVGATVDSARRHFMGKGGQWKGRVEWRNAP